MLSIDEFNSRLPFGSLFRVLKVVGTYISPGGKKTARLLCRCKCGNEKVILFSNIKNTVSCGCHARAVIKDRCQKYFPRVPLLYKIWQQIIKRCYDKNHAGFKYYGANGVRVCDEWKNDYQKFLDWSLANGYKKGLEIDKDILGGGLLYSPMTCCWVPHSVNTRNRRNTIKMEYKGKLLSLPEICELNKLPYMKVWDRLFKLNMSLDDALKAGNYRSGRKKLIKPKKQ